MGGALLLPASSSFWGPGCPWACGRVAPVCAWSSRRFLLFPLCLPSHEGASHWVQGPPDSERSLLHPYLIITSAKTLFPNKSHSEFRVDMNLGGTLSSHCIRMSSLGHISAPKECPGLTPACRHPPCTPRGGTHTLGGPWGLGNGSPCVLARGPPGACRALGWVAGSGRGKVWARPGL